MDGGDDLAANELREILGRAFEGINVDGALRLGPDPGIRAIEFNVGGTLGYRVRVSPTAHLLVDKGLEPGFQ